MRINKQIFLSSLLILAFPTTAAPLGSSGADVGVVVNPDVAEGSNGRVLALAPNEKSSIPTLGSPVSPANTANAASWTSFLSPSYILGGIQNACLPSALRMTGAVQASFMESKPSSPSDFWEMAKKSEKELQEYVHCLLETAVTNSKSTEVTDITSAMNNIVSATSAFRHSIKGPLDGHHITFDTFTEELEGIFMGIVSELEKFSHPDMAPGHAERTEMVDKVLGDTAQALILLASRYGIGEEVITTYLLALKPHVQALTVAVGDINDQHPKLLPRLVLSVATLLIPESWILEPFLGVLGFGLPGPVKGSAAARMQKHFEGAAVEAGSWFSLLQAAGTGVLPKWAWLATKMFLLVGSVVAMLLPCLKRGWLHSIIHLLVPFFGAVRSMVFISLSTPFFLTRIFATRRW